MSERDKESAVDLAGALTSKVQDIFDRNDQLEAECESLKVSFDAVSVEAESLRKMLDRVIRQRDAAYRERDLLHAQMNKINTLAAETMRAVRPAAPKADNDDPSKLAFLRRQPSG